MTLLSHQLFDYCGTSLDLAEPSDEAIDAPQVNPSSGLPLLKNNGIDVGGYVIGDGPLNHDDETSVAIINDCSDPIDLQIDSICALETTSLFEDDFSTCADFCSLSGDWL